MTKKASSQGGGHPLHPPPRSTPVLRSSFQAIALCSLTRCFHMFTDMRTRINLKNNTAHIITAEGTVSFTPCILSILLNTLQKSDRNLFRRHFEHVVS